MYLSVGEIARTRILLGTEDCEQEQEATEKGWPVFADQFYFAGISKGRARNELAIICLLTGSTFVLGIFLKNLIFLFLSAGILALYWGILQHRISSRALRFEKDYPTMLVSLSSAIRTGKDPFSSFIGIKELFAVGSEMYLEIEAASKALNDGASEDSALSRFGASIAHPDIALFRTAFVLARREGSSLGPCLHRLIRVTRQRQSFRRKTKASLAMQKLSATGIVLCCVLIACMQIGLNPKGAVDTWNHPMGKKLISFGLIVMSFGLIWVIRIGKARV